MFAAFLFAAATAGAQPKPRLDVDQAAIREVIRQRYPNVHVHSVIVHGKYAIATGRGSAGSVRGGLQLQSSGWTIVCRLGAAPSASQLAGDCGFPGAAASEMAASFAAESAAEQGDFSTAASMEKRAWASITGPESDQERARVQYLSMLNEQMRTGQITRSQGIQSWSNFRYSWMLP